MPAFIFHARAALWAIKQAELTADRTLSGTRSHHSGTHQYTFNVCSGIIPAGGEVEK